MDMIYPIGSYYITESNDLNTAAKMATKFGGTWAQLDAGRFLEAVTSGAGSNKNAGLPNIKGTFYAARSFMGETASETSASGAFSKEFINSGSKNNLSWGGSNRQCYLYFNAHSSNSIYSDDVTTVQPKSRTVYIYRRTALAGGA